MPGKRSAANSDESAENSTVNAASVMASGGPLSTTSKSERAALSRATGLNKGQLSFYVQRLEQLGFIDKHRPITKAPTAKTVRYRLRDEYLRFYFNFIEGKRARIERSGGGYHFDRLVGKRWDPFLGLGFERFVDRNLEPLLDKVGARDVMSQVGTYWHQKTARQAGVQIDLVIERDDHITHIVECKWSRTAVGKQAIDQLQRKCQLYPNPRGDTLRPILVAAAGVTKAVQTSGVQVITLSDLF